MLLQLPLGLLLLLGGLYDLPGFSTLLSEVLPALTWLDWVMGPLLRFLSALEELPGRVRRVLALPPSPREVDYWEPPMELRSKTPLRWLPTTGEGKFLFKKPPQSFAKALVQCFLPGMTPSLGTNNRKQRRVSVAFFGVRRRLPGSSLRKPTLFQEFF